MTRRTAFLVYLAMLALLGAAVGVRLLDLGAAGPLAVGAAATLQAGLVVYFLMHLNEDRGVLRMAALGGLLWLAVMFALTVADYATR